MVRIRKKEEKQMSCVPVEAFSGATESRQAGLGGRQPGGIA